MQHLEVSGAVRPLKWSLGVKWLSTLTYEVHQFAAFYDVLILLLRNTYM